MEELKNVRVASKAAGDDVTLTRYVRNEHGPRPPRKLQPRLPGMASRFVLEGRSKYPSRVRPVADLSTLLVSGHNNVKIGRDVRKGKFRGYWIYTLSFEERATCPSTCTHWESCYGNNMPFARRADHRDPELLPTIERELKALLATNGRTGILVRLHALGDFYSVEYAEFWARMLAENPRLALYGYTARMPGTPIGNAVALMMATAPGRAMIRFSDGGFAECSTVAIATVDKRPADAFVCPEQTAQTQCCATCGACWSTLKNVAFLDH